MSIIYFLIPIAIILIIIAISIFFWAVRSDQFKDLERHGHSILFDDDLQKTSLQKTSIQNKTLKNTSIKNASVDAPTDTPKARGPEEQKQEASFTAPNDKG